MLTVLLLLMLWLLFVAVSLSSKGLSAVRPKDLSMNSRKLIEAFKVTPRSFVAGIESIKESQSYVDIEKSIQKERSVQ